MSGRARTKRICQAAIGALIDPKKALYDLAKDETGQAFDCWFPDPTTAQQRLLDAVLAEFEKAYTDDELDEHLAASAQAVLAAHGLSVDELAGPGINLDANRAAELVCRRGITTLPTAPGDKRPPIEVDAAIDDRLRRLVRVFYAGLIKKLEPGLQVAIFGRKLVLLEGIDRKVDGLINHFDLTSTPAKFRATIRRFLQDYLGTQQRPVPFGGRDALFAELNKWLADPTAASNLLVTAPAGRGKTALLVRWLSQVDHETWPVAFVPISIRYETSQAGIFYPAFAAQLADVLGEKLPQTPIDPASFYRDKVIDYLEMFRKRDCRCLVVIDGLDEAAGWQVATSVLPLDPAPGLRIIASARLLAGDRGSSGWLRRLGWNTRPQLAHSLEVPLLDRHGVADVIEKLGLPLASFSGRVDVLAELLRLTCGEPLEIELYVKALLERDNRATSLDVEQLRALRPGIAEFFTNWWDQQRRVWRDTGAAFDEQTTQALLAVLACALGPLRLVELTRLIKQVHEIQQIVSRDTLEPIQRFIIGDGTEVGYSFSHPKLREYFKDTHFGGGDVIKRTRAGFIEWGQKTVRELNEARLTASENPDYAYLLEHYNQHWFATPASEVHTAERAKALLELVSDGWHQAWEAYEGSTQGFASDVRAAWQAVRQARSSGDRELGSCHLGAEIRCVLSLSSICSRGTNVPADLLAQAVECDAMSARRAEYIAGQKGGEPENRVDALLALAPHLPETKRFDLLDDVRALPDDNNRAKALLRVAEHLQSAKERSALLSEARRLAFDLQKPEQSAQVIALLLPLLSDDEDRAALANAALTFARRIDNAADRALRLADLVRYLPPEIASLTWAHALEAAQSDGDAVSGCGAITQLTLRLPEKHSQRCMPALIDAIKAVQAIIPHFDKNDPHFQNRVRRAIEVYSCAKASLARLEEDPYRRAILSDEAAASARTQPEGYYRVAALTAIIPHLFDSKRTEVFEDAVQLARALPTGNNRTHALGRLAALALPDRRRELVLDALNAARLIEDEYGRFLVLIRIAQRTSGEVSHAAVQRASNLVGRINYPIQKSNALAQLAQFLSPSERERALTTALNLVLFFSTHPFRASAIVNLLPLLPANLQITAVKRVLSDEPHHPFHVLHVAELIEKTSGELRKEVLEYSLSKVQNPELQFRHEALLIVLKFVEDKALRHALIDDVLLWIGGLADDQKARELARLAQLADQRDDWGEVLRLAECIKEAIERLEDDDGRSTVLVDVVATIPESQREHFIGRALDDCKSCGSHLKRSRNLAKLVPYLGDSDRAEAIALAFDSAKAVEHPTRRLEVLKAVAPLLGGAERDEAVDLLLDCSAQLERRFAFLLIGDLPSLLPEKHHATVLLPAMAALDETAEWFS